MSKPVSGSHWFKTSTTDIHIENINIEIRDLQSCKEEKGFKINPHYHKIVAPRGNMSLEDCKKWGEKKNSEEKTFFAISYRPNFNLQCYILYEPLVKIEEDSSSTLFINESTTCSCTTTTKTLGSSAIDNRKIDHKILKSDTETVNRSDDKIDHKILYISISAVVLLILLIITLTIYICKFKRSKATKTIITENESYGIFSDFGDYYEEKSQNIISDGNEYYEEKD